MFEEGAREAREKDVEPNIDKGLQSASNSRNRIQVLTWLIEY